LFITNLILSCGEATSQAFYIILTPIFLKLRGLDIQGRNRDNLFPETRRFSRRLYRQTAAESSILFRGNRPRIRAAVEPKSMS
jgi:hypothetical protein